MRREFGGCAGNIAYNLKLLGGEPVIMATVGDDYRTYSQRLDKLGIEQSIIRSCPSTYTAQAFITTDLDDNQITAFHPGAMNHSHANSVTERAASRSDRRPRRPRRHAAACARVHGANIPFIFDPGQGLPMFSGEELLDFVRMAQYVTVNDYEAQMLQERTGRNIEDLAKLASAFLVTLGARGSLVYTGGQSLTIPCVKAEAVVDPTGCGDAFRAGLLYGIAAGYDWPTTGRLASLLGSIKIAQRGGQNRSLHPRRDRGALS